MHDISILSVFLQKWKCTIVHYFSSLFQLEEMINFWHPDDRAEELAIRRAEREAQIQIMKDNVRPCHAEN